MLVFVVPIVSGVIMQSWMQAGALLAAFSAIAVSTVFFGYQSVGMNVLKGRKGRRVAAMVPACTDAGWQLNREGRTLAVRALVSLLASIPVPPNPGAAIPR